MSICAWIISSCVSITIGMLLAVARCNRMQWPLARHVIALYTFIAKGIPVYVHILIAYFVVPLTIGINIPPFVAGTLALAFCSSGYVADIISAGIDAVNEGQQQAAFVLGYTNLQCMQRIILPQALTIIRPALFGECEQLLKSSSLLATIGIVEITRAGMNIISRELNPIPVYIMIACIYLFFSALLYALKTYISSKETCA